MLQRMASIRKQIHIDVPPDQAWSALSDVGALHTRLVPGFVTDTQLAGNSRQVTFGDGTTVREDIVSVDATRKRVAWAIVGQQFHHYQGAARVAAEGHGCLFIWTADVLPDEFAPKVDAMMSAGLAVIKETLEAAK